MLTLGAPILYAVLSTLAIGSVEGAAVHKRAVTYNINGGTKMPISDPAPVGISYEFFAFPEYVQSVSATQQCMANLDAASTSSTRVRIGGTTQDRATYDPTLTSAVSYSVPSRAAAPGSLTYGPSYFDLAGALNRPATIGINRRLNQLSNGIQAAQMARSKMSNLYAFELGNEPDLYGSSSPIAQANGGTWNPSVDANVQTSWQKSFSQGLGNLTDFVQAGVFLQPPTWSVKNFKPTVQSKGTLPLIKTFADHSYPQSACGGSKTNLPSLQNHSGIVSYMAASRFTDDIAAAASLGRPLDFGETNSATCGGGGISPTYGAGLWVMDYVMQSVIRGIQRLYFHHGTVDYSPYSWWDTNSVQNPYYGAIVAATALGGMSSIAQLDTGKTYVGAYVLYSGSTPKRALLYNSKYFVSTAARTYEAVSLSGLADGTVNAKRLTAAYPDAAVGTNGARPTFGGQQFQDKTCAVTGTETFEQTRVLGGSATFSVGDSEALLIYL